MPMVARAENGNEPRYIVLDGASRTSALRKLEIPHILVQIVDYHSPQVKLESWNHLLLDISIADLRRELDDVSCVTMVEMEEAQAQKELGARSVLGYLKFTDGTIAGLRCSSDPVEQAHALNEVVRARRIPDQVPRERAHEGVVLEQTVRSRNGTGRRLHAR